VLAAAAVSGSAFAEEKTTMLEEIVVTAQKRQESLQEVPIAISVFTSEGRDQLGIITLQDFTDFTPGVTYSTSLDRMSIRGVGRQTNNLATSSAVATYGDGFYNPATIKPTPRRCSPNKSKCSAVRKEPCTAVTRSAVR
jgi:iron complex outermembrane recepter protein